MKNAVTAHWAVRITQKILIVRADGANCDLEAGSSLWLVLGAHRLTDGLPGLERVADGH